MNEIDVLIEFLSMPKMVISGEFAKVSALSDK